MLAIVCKQLTKSGDRVNGSVRYWISGIITHRTGRHACNWTLHVLGVSRLAFTVGYLNPEPPKVNTRGRNKILIIITFCQPFPNKSARWQHLIASTHVSYAYHICSLLISALCKERTPSRDLNNISPKRSVKINCSLLSCSSSVES